ncbi:MAG: hypothetical protein IIC90_08900 [Chloroflexi bacterium]|nr:hypothetical protein [Chloroflexota bacterium]
MAEWRYRIQPGIELAILSRRKPSLLSHILGGEVAEATEPSLVLDLEAREESEAGASPSGSASGPATARGVYKGIAWRYNVQREGDRWRVAFRSRLFQEYLALHIALLPALQRLLLDRDLTLIHGAAFTSDDGATLLAGMTGSGKTALLLGAIREGGQFIGDEYLSLSAAGAVTPIVHTLALRQASLRLSGGALQPLSPLRRLALRTAAVAAALTGRRLDPLNHIPPQEFGLPVADDTGLRARRFFWLEASDAASPFVCEPATPVEVIEKLSLMQQVHDANYGDLGLTFDAATGRATDEHNERWRANLARGLADTSCYRLRYPRQALAQALDLVLSLERP